MDHATPNGRSASDRRTRVLPLIALGLGACGPLLVFASAWMPWYHWGGNPFYAPPGCSLPADPIVWSVLGATVIGSVGVASRRPILGICMGVGALSGMMHALLSGLLTSGQPCGTTATVWA